MSKQPNILFILTDHQAYYGHHRPGEFDYRLPRFDSFCQEGVKFDRAYCVAPICTPARTSMMTGLYPSHHGLLFNTERPGKRDIDLSQELYSHHLSNAGYRNAYVGKWHCGHERLPTDYGIEGWSLPDYGKIYMSEAYKTYAEERGFGEARAHIDYHLNRPEWNDKTITLHDPSPWAFMNGSGVLEGPPEAHEEQFVAHLASEKLRELSNDQQPWSLVASFWGPYQPYYPSEPYASMVDPSTIPEYPTFNDDLEGRPLRYAFHRDINHRSSHEWPEWSTWQTILGRAYGQGYQTDAAVGKILDTLRESGQEDNTLVIWCADHGDALASHGGMWDKATTYIEEVARVPLAVRWPEAINPDQSNSQPISNLDVTATMLDAAGITVPEEMHSRSLLPLCQEPASAAWPDHVICQHHGHVVELTQRICITDRFKYVAALFDGDELYDLEDDPFETNNLINSAAHKDTLRQLQGYIIDRIEETNDRKAVHLAHAIKLGWQGFDHSLWVPQQA